MSRSIEQLVNQQVLRWMQEQRAAEGALALHAREAQRPMVTISREYGALGGTLGRQVSHALGYEYYAQELVHEIAKHAHVRRRVVESLDERSQTRIGSWVNEMIIGGIFAPSDYLRNLSQVIVTLGRHGRAVVVGRGAHLILDPSRTLRVRTYAPIEHRVRYIAQRDSLPLSAARRRVQRIDDERTQFYQQHFKNDVGAHLNFDILLNTSTLNVAECVNIVMTAFKRRFEGPSN
jgi:cytidylate kinase